LSGSQRFFIFLECQFQAFSGKIPHLSTVPSPQGADRRFVIEGRFVFLIIDLERRSADRRYRSFGPGDMRSPG
jgi:hypothetical protein